MKFNFDFNLPFKLPLESNQKFYSNYGIVEYILNFNTYTRSIVVDDSLFQSSQECTKITVDYIIPKDNLHNIKEVDEILRTVILNTISYLNKFFDAIRASFNLEYVHNITIADLPPIIIIKYGDKDYIYVTNPQDYAYKEFVLGEEGLKKLQNKIKIYDDHHDLYLVEKFFHSAKSHFYKEQFIDVIIDLQTSFEIFIRNSHKLILLKNGKEEQELSKASSIAFRNVLEDHLGKKFLKTDLGFKSNPIIKDWYDGLYSVRNEIVHSGKIDITGEIALEAHRVYVNARNYISKALKENGYLNYMGEVDLSLFKGSTKGSIDEEALIKRLKELDMIE
ncbi:hypothetical protein C7B71_13270 [Bacillus halotolerans]|uniref:hypothetical protein n=1 Tax=Bacillus halotolerans TaxID=260554 RepID=UPI000D0263B4|nr:hypothetical protein [Bacillus halotolerans]PRP54270.1 hypothetical protein C7B71_13270 [Bacillus halotolerans]